MDTFGIPLLGVAGAATEATYFLGEGPFWDPIRGDLRWVSITDGAVYRGRLEDNGTILVRDRLEIPGTASAVSVSRGGELIVAGTDRLYYQGANGKVRSSRRLISGHGRRFNDGKADPLGRFVVGTMSDSGVERLLIVHQDETITVVDDDLTLANGLAWSVNGKRFYYADTLTGRIWVRDFDPATGSSGERTMFAELSNGHPDGLTVDAEDHIWVAVWGGGEVLRLAPSGDVVGRVEVPVPHVSCPVFAGSDLSTLVITTAREGLVPEELSRFPLSGRLFTLRTGISGQPPSFWAGTPDNLMSKKGKS